MTDKRLQEIVPGAILTTGTRADADDCLRLRTAVSLELERDGTPELCLAAESPEEFRAFFDDQESRALVLRTADGKLVGFGIATYRGESRLKFRALIPDFDASPRNVAYVKLIQVAPKYRGRRLQRLFFSELETWARENGSSYAVGIVSPANVASVENFRRGGYREAERFIFEPIGYERIRMIKRLVGGDALVR